MLIRFTVENFRSFNEEVVFSMLPGRTKTHKEHILSFPKSGIGAMRIALLYGANASGKSNLVKAMEFAQKFIVTGRRPKQRIPIEPFRLNKTNDIRPSRFEFEFAVDDQVYAYGFLAGGKRVHEEWLYSVNAKTEHPLFERETDQDGSVTASFTHPATMRKEDKQFLNFVKRSTRPNQLLLTTLVDQNVTDFEPIMNWFQNRLTIIFPNSFAMNLQINVHKDQQFSHTLTEFLRSMDTGVDEICTKPVELDALDFPIDMIIEKLSEAGNENGTHQINVFNQPDGRYLIYRDKDGHIETHILSTRHYVGDEVIDFDLIEESDGTQRLLDLFPVLYGAEDRIYVIDELERSLHPNLVRRFIKSFLAIHNRSQLLFTTHESTLLDPKLLRRDEIWFVEKSKSGASSVYSLEEFKTRNDLDIRKGYLHGRFGAIPVFGSALHMDSVEE